MRLKNVNAIQTSTENSAGNLWMSVEIFGLLLVMREEQLKRDTEVTGITAGRVLVGLDGKVPHSNLLVI